ncbi:Bromodomain containing protein [Histomonas meleagridis]|uniref:Bromodomain containing protein n=1 Tax=Histomonas meleagridis TaxID=135588 RepID=UPI0035594193|nr:Bromodomain containing protein [Histomonas meleagridis]KAH0804925.1 Bromodomain containing protein [Histomonas meleagridis]
MLTKELLSEAISAMNRIMEHPIANFFLEPVIPEPDSGITITDQIGLNIVYDKLKSHQYKSLYEWESDVEIVFYNVEQYYSPNSIAGCVAQEMRRIFNRERRFAMKCSVSLWTNRLTNLRSKLADLVHDAPNRVANQMPNYSKGETPNYHQLQLTGHEVQSFQLAFEAIQTEDEKNEIISIIKRVQPGLLVKSGNITLNQRLLSDESIAEIKNYMKECLNQKGIRFLE